MFGKILGSKVDEFYTKNSQVFQRIKNPPHSREKRNEHTIFHAARITVSACTFLAFKKNLHATFRRRLAIAESRVSDENPPARSANRLTLRTDIVGLKFRGTVGQLCTASQWGTAAGTGSRRFVGDHKGHHSLVSSYLHLELVTDIIYA